MEIMDIESDGGERTNSRQPKVLNKSVAQLQITAEQLMREAWERQEETTKAPRQKIGDEEELAEYQLRKRTEYENTLRAKRHTMGIWLRYAKWEETQNEYERARSIYERALKIEYKNPQLWMKYAEMEMKHKSVNHARNVWDRAVQLLPRANQLWYKYVHMEEQLSNYIGVRKIYERWMEWEPEENAWTAYLAFERRNGEVELARNILRRFVMVHQSAKSWLKFARFEEKHGEIDNARAVFDKALEVLNEHPEQHAQLYLAFAKFEERMKEFDRARAIYRYALDRIPKSLAREVFQKFIQFEKQHGDKDEIEDIILGKRRFQYEELLAEDSTNYDIWFDYIRLEEVYSANKEKVREIYERAISSQNMPPVLEKHYWKRYVFLWINYALFEEMETKDYDRVREVFKLILKIIPHKKFTFPKLWIMFAHFEVRRQDLEAARKVFGTALGVAPSPKIYTAYIEMEMQLAQINRCRTLYEKWVTSTPEYTRAWIKFAELEADPQLQETERARAIFELGVAQPALDAPELLWKAYIDFEIDNEEYDHVRTLYRRLLEKTSHVRVWISFSKFEISIGKIPRARAVFQEAFQALKPVEFQQQRVLLIESWRDFEEEYGNTEDQAFVRNNFPSRITKRKKLKTEDGEDAGVEVYYEYVFPDCRQVHAGLSLLEAANRWKEQQQTS